MAKKTYAHLPESVKFNRTLSKRINAVLSKIDSLGNLGRSSTYYRYLEPEAVQAILEESLEKIEERLETAKRKLQNPAKPSTAVSEDEEEMLLDEEVMQQIQALDPKEEAATA